MRPVTDEGYADAIARWAMRFGKGIPPVQAVRVYFATVLRTLDPLREKRIKTILAKRAGKKSAAALRSRKKIAVLEADKARQPKLPFT